MGIFVCSKCGVVENTATSNFWNRKIGEKALCSECDPEIGKWHGRFPKKKWNPNELKKVTTDIFTLLYTKKEIEKLNLKEDNAKVI